MLEFGHEAGDTDEGSPNCKWYWEQVRTYQSLVQGLFYRSDCIIFLGWTVHADSASVSHIHHIVSGALGHTVPIEQNPRVIALQTLVIFIAVEAVCITTHRAHIIDDNRVGSGAV